MVTSLEGQESAAQGMFVVGSGVDVTAVKARLADLVSVPVIAPEEPQLALARGAALASASAPRYDTSTIGLAYSQDPGATTVHPMALADDATTFLGTRRRHRYPSPADVPERSKPFAVGGQLAGRRLRSGNDGTGHRNGDQCPADRRANPGRASRLPPRALRAACPRCRVRHPPRRSSCPPRSPPRGRGTSQRPPATARLKVPPATAAAAGVGAQRCARPGGTTAPAPPPPVVAPPPVVLAPWPR